MEIKKDLVIYKRLLRSNVFSYRQLAENVILTICDSIVAQPSMLDLCRQYFFTYQTHLTSINKFAKKYRSWQAAC